MDRFRQVSNRITDQMRSVDTKPVSSTMDSARETFASLTSKVMATISSPNKKGNMLQHKQREKFHLLEVEVGEKVHLRIMRDRRREAFSAVLGESVPQGTEYAIERGKDSLTVKYIGYGKLKITYIQLKGGERYDIDWSLSDDSEVDNLQDSINLSTCDWFPAALSSHQSWPAMWQTPLVPFVSQDLRYDPEGGYGSILERYWLSSSGTAVYCDSEVPLFVATNIDDNQQLTFLSKFDKPYRNLVYFRLFLKYSIYFSDNIKQTHNLVSADHFMKMDSLPNDDLFQRIIWSTSRYFGQELTQEKLIDYVDNIIDNGLEPGILEIGDDWNPAYGDLTFDEKRFPDPKAMISYIKRKGFKVMVWIHPFSSPRSSAFYGGGNLWVKSSVVEGLTTWEHGPAKVLDLTNPESRTWIKKKLRDLQQEYDIDCFMFDGGHVSYLPPLFNTYEPLDNPNRYSRAWVDVARDISPGRSSSIINIGVGTQRIPIMLITHDKRTEWHGDIIKTDTSLISEEHHDGLRTVIPTALTISIMGYHLGAIPGVVGGRTVRKDAGHELYIRWLQTVLFMPGIKLSVPPWEYDESVMDIVKSLLDTRNRFMDYLMQVVSNSQRSGDPVIRPLWWMAPTDSVAITVDSQYMLGDELMVAPVLEKGMTNRSIYLPKGQWKDELRGNIVEGKRWLYSYRARLAELPHFTLIKDDMKSEADNNEKKAGKQTDSKMADRNNIVSENNMRKDTELTNGVINRMRDRNKEFDSEILDESGIADINNSSGMDDLMNDLHGDQ